MTKRILTLYTGNHCLEHIFRTVVLSLLLIVAFTNDVNGQSNLLQISEPASGQSIMGDVHIKFVTVGNSWVRYHILKENVMVRYPQPLPATDGEHIEVIPTAKLAPGTYKLTLIAENSPEVSIDVVLVPGQNYIKTYTARVATGSSLSVISDHNSVSTKVDYFDGLGRPMQSVVKRGSPDGSDLITNVGYDEYGRQHKTYLPYEKDGSTNGLYRSTWEDEIASFYSSSSTNDVADEETYYYSETKFEPSPLNRVEKTLAPGAAWVGAGRGVTTTYGTNASDEIYRLFVASNGLISTSGGNYYGSGQLYKTTTTDADNNVIVEYTNKQGQVVCKRAYLDATNYAATYYLYDNFGLLRYVVQPQGVDDMGTDPSLLNDMDFRDKWMFQYQYDQRQRMILKKVPGAEPVYMIYDKRDRLVLTQDGNQRGVEVKNLGSTDYETDQYEWTNYDISSTGSVTLKPGFSFKANLHRSFYAGQNAQAVNGEWTYTKYDTLNRPVMTGVVTLSGSREDLQEDVDAISDFTVAYVGNTSTDVYGYDNSSYPSATTSNVLTVTYYDNYNFVNNLSWGSGYTNSGHNANVIGLMTGGQVRQLGGGMLKSVTYYDSRLRPIKNIDQNHLGGTDKVTTTYANLVSPRVTSTVRTHTASGQPTLTITENYTYDHMDRLLTTTHKINSQGTVTLHSNSYNEIGELIEKDLRGSASPVQSVDYKYNIRGWLTHINNGTSFDSGENDKFGMELQYNAAGQYNGNIGKMQWKSIDNDSYTYDAAQNFVFTYDGLNRLKKAAYSGSGSNHYTVGGDDGGKIRYDLNGNIQSLSRYKNVKFFSSGGTVSFSSRLIDNLSYNYLEGNQLSKVTDLSTETEIIDKRSGMPEDEVRDEGFKDGADDIEEYLYDANGNMISDANKGITNINYNYLNLPESVTTPDGTISYTYDASGMKLRKFYDRTGGTDETTDYVGGIQYKDGVQNFIQHAEGRALKSGSTFNYEYNLTDHLGNVRVTVNNAGSVIQRDDYYPFGLTFNSYSSGTENHFKFNGVEQDPTTGNYETLFRGYDPALGRFMQIDPLADFLPGINPYQFAFNNPILLNDPDGLAPKWWIKLRAHFNRLKNYLEGSNAAGVASGYTGTGKNRYYYTYQTKGGKRRGEDHPVFFPTLPEDRVRPHYVQSIGPMDLAPLEPRFPELTKIEIDRPSPPTHNRNDMEYENRPVSGTELRRSVKFNGADWTFADDAAARRSIQDAYSAWKKSPHLTMIIRAMTEVGPQVTSMRNTRTGLTNPTNSVLTNRARAIMKALRDLGVPYQNLQQGSPVFNADDPGFQIDFK